MKEFDGIRMSIVEALVTTESQPWTDGPAPLRKSRMKRISIAEQTLKKQIEMAYARIGSVQHEIDTLSAQKHVYQQIILDLETEQIRLRAIREVESTVRKAQP